MIQGENLWHDEWFKTMTQTIVTGLIHMQSNPRAEYQEFKIIYSKRPEGIKISYPGPNGQESVIKTCPLKEDI